MLLDTHAWLWWQSRDRRLGRAARLLISSAGDVLFSAASAWEIAIKSATGKLEIPAGSNIERELEIDGFLQLPVTIAHTDAVRQLPLLHRDPFDRMLIAQALVEGLAIVTADHALQAYGVALVDARA